jgi:hypothetical protein
MPLAAGIQLLVAHNEERSQNSSSSPTFRRPIMARRLARITAEACLEAITIWLERQLGLKPRTAEVLRVEDAVWLEFRDLADKTFPEKIEYTVARVLLTNRVHWDPSEPITRGVLIVDIYEQNPTPRVTQTAQYRSTDTLRPWQRVAVVATPDGVEARDCFIVSPQWGVDYSWPFAD